jgi:sulfide:quinone oxidoreductase
MKNNYQIVIVGAGTGGIMTAAQLLRKDKNLEIAIIDPSEKHIYQPAWTLVGGGSFNYNKTIRPTSSVIPKGVTWIKDKVVSLEPDNNNVTTEKNGTISYQYLVLAPGLVYDLDGIEGLRENLGKNGVCSNYTDPNYTWELIKNFKGGNAVFTQPTTPIKCGGAPQKIAYLAADYFRKNKTPNTEVVFATPGSVIFGVKEFAKTLMQVIFKYGIHFKPHYAPVKIDGEKKLVYFKSIAPEENQCVINEGNVLNEEFHGESEIVMPYDILHLAPPQMAPDFIRNSSLVNAQKWLDVDILSLQHLKYKNIFGLGDVAALPTAKTGAAIRKQAPVVVDNLLSMIKDNKLGHATYEGYSSCPLVTGYGKMVLAEFKYDNVRDSDPFLSKFVDTTKENWSMWILKKYGLPYLYWNKMMKGKM